MQAQICVLMLSHKLQFCSVVLCTAYSCYAHAFDFFPSNSRVREGLDVSSAPSFPSLPSRDHWCSLLVPSKRNRIEIIIWDRREAVGLLEWHVPLWRGRHQLHQWMPCTSEDRAPQEQFATPQVR